MDRVHLSQDCKPATKKYSFLITKFPAFPGTHLIDLGRMKDIFGHI